MTNPGVRENSIKVEATEKDGKRIAVFDSISQACRKLFLPIEKYKSGRKITANPAITLNRYHYSRSLKRNVYLKEVNQ